MKKPSRTRKCLSKIRMRKLFGQRVYVFKEIKNKVWTVWNEDRTERLFWARELNLTNASFFVDQSKRNQVMKSRKRIPHAGVFGILSDIIDLVGAEVYYNPFLTKKFQKKELGTDVSKAKALHFNKNGKVFGVGFKK
jgi:hypothetical protein